MTLGWSISCVWWVWLIHFWAGKIILVPVKSYHSVLFEKSIFSKVDSGPFYYASWEMYVFDDWSTLKYVCSHVCMYVCMHAYGQVRMYVIADPVYVCDQSHTYKCLHTYRNKNTCYAASNIIYVYIYIYVYSYMHTNMHAYIHIRRGQGYTNVPWREDTFCVAMINQAHVHFYMHKPLERSLIFFSFFFQRRTYLHTYTQRRVAHNLMEESLLPCAYSSTPTSGSRDYSTEKQSISLVKVSFSCLK